MDQDMQDPDPTVSALFSRGCFVWAKDVRNSRHCSAEVEASLRQPLYRAEIFIACSFKSLRNIHKRNSQRFKSENEESRRYENISRPDPIQSGQETEASIGGISDDTWKN
ncbi:hypothetical protein HNY73_002338 [Argiope bruennichi]|uniref:Uncharacterized protein n=1 Tax=Argiope bruennichi TaxID=94029 RepID=A0A8T0FT67_ARGBR|nr:hypothetical protein HNY73_002338 [Argiope bruennichi]